MLGYKYVCHKFTFKFTQLSWLGTLKIIKCIKLFLFLGMFQWFWISPIYFSPLGCRVFFCENTQLVVALFAFEICAFVFAGMTLCPITGVKGRVLSKHFNVTLVGDDDAIMLTNGFFDLRVCISGTSWLI